MRSLPGTVSVWLNLEPLPSCCHPHTSVTSTCDIDCGCGFGAGGGTVNHSTPSSPTIFPRSPLLSVSLHLARIRICALNCGEARFDIPAETTDMAVHPPRPNRPSHGDWLGHTRIRARTHIAKALFIWGKWKEAFLISFHVIDLWRRGCVCMSVYVCA